MKKLATFFLAFFFIVYVFFDFVLYLIGLVLRHPVAVDLIITSFLIALIVFMMYLVYW